MSHSPHRGRVYRRCACRDTNGKQLGPRCPQLASGTKHGFWSFAVDMPSIGRKRTTMRRSGYPTRKAALSHVLECERAGIWLDDKQTVSDYLTGWLADKALTLKPTTIANYTAYVRNDLIPALGAVRLEKLNQFHIARFIHDQLSDGRGPTTLRRCVAALSSALNDAVRHHRLQHNPARFAPLPPPPKTEQRCWAPSQAAAFLQHCAKIEDPLTDLFELIIGTGLRKREALALHWADVHLDQAVLFVRYTLSNISNSTQVMTAPKTKSSHAWVSLSARVISALEHQARHPANRHLQPDLVFCRPNGLPLRPEYVLRHFRQLTTAAGLPTIRPDSTPGAARPSADFVKRPTAHTSSRYGPGWR
jgi:integrase